MSFAVLALAVEAADRHECEPDEEFGWSACDLGVDHVLQVRWVIYQTVGAGRLLRVAQVEAGMA